MPVSRPIITHCGRAYLDADIISARPPFELDSAEVCVQFIVLFQLTSQVKVFIVLVLHVYLKLGSKIGHLDTR